MLMDDGTQLIAIFEDDDGTLFIPMLVIRYDRVTDRYMIHWHKDIPLPDYMRADSVWSQRANDQVMERNYPWLFDAYGDWWRSDSTRAGCNS